MGDMGDKSVKNRKLSIFLFVFFFIFKSLQFFT